MNILNILKKHHTQAIFFINGDKALQYPELFLEILKQGHILANHGHEHLHGKEVPIKKFIDNVELLEKELLKKRTTCKKNKLFRPPYGAIRLRALLCLLLRGYRIMFWSIDSLDSFITNETELLDHISKINYKNGDILLFHEDNALTTACLDRILTFFDNKNLSCKKIAI
jgi:peptidoglycan/xylan/chitin deacetylase (PgdA/CDA1 family)